MDAENDLTTEHGISTFSLPKMLYLESEPKFHHDQDRPGLVLVHSGLAPGGRGRIDVTASMAAVMLTAAWRGVDDDVGNVKGAYILTATNPAFPPVKHLLTFHQGGTLSETNTISHANSAAPLNFASDGYGAWQKGRRNTVDFRIVKLMFNRVTNAHAGYIVGEGTAAIDRDGIFSGALDVFILIGPDLDAPLFVIPLGTSDLDGRRITVH